MRTFMMFSNLLDMMTQKYNFYKWFDENINGLILLSNYKNARTKIMVADRYGICSIYPHALKYSKPSIVSAVDKNSYFINMFKERFPNSNFNFSEFEYVKNDVKGKVKCCNNHTFYINPNNLLSGHGCKYCATEITKIKNSKTNEEFIQESKLKHGEVYDYSKVDYVNNKTKVCIICAKHGEFYTTPSDHLRGYRCPKCGNESTGRKLRKLPKKLDLYKRRLVNLISTSYRRKGWKKSSRTREILGCDYQQLVKHLEDNKYGFKVTDENMNIDHIIPISSAKSIQDLNLLNHYTNLQLLPEYYNKYIKRHHPFDKDDFELWLKSNK